MENSSQKTSLFQAVCREKHPFPFHHFQLICIAVGPHRASRHSHSSSVPDVNLWPDPAFANLGPRVGANQWPGPRDPDSPKRSDSMSGWGVIFYLQNDVFLVP